MLAMMLNELATNALKHGALLHAEGCVHVHWDHVVDGGNEDMLRFIWEEVHTGPLPEVATGGFGTEFLESAVSYELDGESSIEVGAKGLIFKASIPLRSLMQEQPSGDSAPDSID